MTNPDDKDEGLNCAVIGRLHATAASEPYGQCIVSADTDAPRGMTCAEPLDTQESAKETLCSVAAQELSEKEKAERWLKVNIRFPYSHEIDIP